MSLVSTARTTRARAAFVTVAAAVALVASACTSAAPDNATTLTTSGTAASRASYADARVGQNRSQTVGTRERRVQGLSDNETAGVGVRALVDGAWGFAATSDLSPDAVTAAARQAVAQARANRRAQVRPVELAPVTPTPNGEWRSPIQVDPFTVPVADKVALLLSAVQWRDFFALGTVVAYFLYPVHAYLLLSYIVLSKLQPRCGPADAAVRFITTNYSVTTAEMHANA